jgi:hypothetical protein
MSLINTYSAVILGLLLFLGVLLFVLRRGGSRRGWLALAVITVLSVITWFSLRPVQTENNNDTLQSLLAQGKFVLLEFQSPY